MSKTDFAVLGTQNVAKRMGVRFYRPGPADKAYAGTRYDSRIPLHVWAMVAIGVVGSVVIWLTR